MSKIGDIDWFFTDDGWQFGESYPVARVYPRYGGFRWAVCSSNANEELSGVCNSLNDAKIAAEDALLDYMWNYE